MNTRSRLNSIGVFATCMCAAAICECNCVCACQCLPTPNSSVASYLNVPISQNHSTNVSYSNAAVASNQNKLGG
jgi:hypothetical protein